MSPRADLVHRAAAIDRIFLAVDGHPIARPRNVKQAGQTALDLAQEHPVALELSQALDHLALEHRHIDPDTVDTDLNGGVHRGQRRFIESPPFSSRSLAKREVSAHRTILAIIPIIDDALHESNQWAPPFLAQLSAQRAETAVSMAETACPLMLPCSMSWVS